MVPRNPRDNDVAGKTEERELRELFVGEQPRFETTAQVRNRVGRIVSEASVCAVVRGNETGGMPQTRKLLVQFFGGGGFGKRPRDWEDAKGLAGSIRRKN